MIRVSAGKSGVDRGECKSELDAESCSLELPRPMRRIPVSENANDDTPFYTFSQRVVGGIPCARRHREIRIAPRSPAMLLLPV